METTALRRDQHSNAVLNTDKAALNKYKKERALFRKVEMLTRELSEVKAALERCNEKLEQIENR